MKQFKKWFIGIWLVAIIILITVSLLSDGWWGFLRNFVE
jgi:hypothetical protein